MVIVCSKFVFTNNTYGTQSIISLVLFPFLNNENTLKPATIMVYYFHYER